MKLDISLAPLDEQPIIRKMLATYLYELSEYTASKPNPSGEFEYPYFDHYWHEPQRHPFILRVHEQPAGFVFVNQFAYSPNIDHSIAEFYIAPNHRNQGLGKRVACSIFDRFPGRWEIRALKANQAAQAFWTKTIATYTNGNFTQQTTLTTDWSGTLWTFSTT